MLPAAPSGGSGRKAFALTLRGLDLKNTTSLPEALLAGGSAVWKPVFPRVQRRWGLTVISRFAIVALLVAGLTGAAFAQDATPQPTPATPTPAATPDPTLTAYGAQYPNCREWTDSCSVCVRDDAGKLRCSLPGIACQPKAIACSKEAP